MKITKKFHPPKNVNHINSVTPKNKLNPYKYSCTPKSITPEKRIHGKKRPIYRVIIGRVMQNIIPIIYINARKIGPGANKKLIQFHGMMGNHPISR